MKANTLKGLLVVIGPTSSDKSTWAVIRAKTLSLKDRVIVVRPRRSMRPNIGEEEGLLVTKSGFRFACIEIDHPRELYNLPEADVYVIEEPAIFPGESEGPVVADAVEELRKEARVIAVGLGATSEMRPFGHSMGILLQVADDILCMKGLCNWCGRDQSASRSVYMNPSEAKEDDVKVGGTESYRPACVECYNEVASLSPRGKLEKLHPSLSIKIGE